MMIQWYKFSSYLAWNAISIILFWSTFGFGFNEHYIVTKFADLETYVDRLLNRTNFMKPIRTITDWNPAFICRDLFGTRGFEMRSDFSGIINKYSPIMINITDEKIQLYQSLDAHVRDARHEIKFRLGSKKMKLSHKFYPCYDYNGDRTWMVMYNPLFKTGLLFQKSRSTKLVALIDSYYIVSAINHSNRAQIISPSNLILAYNTHIEGINDPEPKQALIESAFLLSSSKIIPGSGDPLCSLNDNLKFRLCVMGADVLHKSKGFHQTIYRIREEQYKVDVPFKNFHYLTSGSNESCPKILINFKHDDLPIEGVVYNPLYCHVSIQGIHQYRFYLSQDIVNLDGMFIIKKKKRNTLFDLIEVPLLHRISYYDFEKIFDEDIITQMQRSLIIN